MRSLALYIHWPFCLKKCPYCDFNSHVPRPGQNDEDFAAGLRRELAHYAALLGGRRLTSIFFGGGTPSLLAPREIAHVIDDAVHYFSPAPDLEVTLEANPSSLEVARLPIFKDSGVNRISLGVQSFDDDVLAFLGRQHSARQAITALEKTYQSFERVNFDLIYARPEQTLAQWDEELRFALSFSPTHLSAYQLTIEPHTSFATFYRKKAFQLPSEARAAELYQLTEERLGAAQLNAYEISNYAIAGAQSRHNLAYWHYDDYLGIGAGAHSRLVMSEGRYGHENIKNPILWLQHVKQYGHGQHKYEHLSPHDSAIEMFLMGLRLQEGLCLDDVKLKTGLNWRDLVDKTILDALIEEGYLEMTSSHLRPTFSGRLRLEAILGALLL